MMNFKRGEYMRKIFSVSDTEGLKKLFEYPQ